MYSPKIDEELIPRLYRLRKLKKIPMTRIVNEILRSALPALEEEERKKELICLNVAERQSGGAGERVSPNLESHNSTNAKPTHETRLFSPEDQCRTKSRDNRRRRSISGDSGTGVG